MFRPEKPGGVKRLHRCALGADFHVLTDADERGNRRIPRSERSRYHRAQVRHRERLRRHVAGVPVVLMPRVENESEVRGLKCPDERAAIDHAGDALETL